MKVSKNVKDDAFLFELLYNARLSCTGLIIVVVSQFLFFWLHPAITMKNKHSHLWEHYFGKICTASHYCPSSSIITLLYSAYCWFFFYVRYPFLSDFFNIHICFIHLFYNFFLLSNVHPALLFFTFLWFYLIFKAPPLLTFVHLSNILKPFHIQNS